MIFSNGLDDKVRDGTKTQTRRLANKYDYLVHWPMRRVFRGVQDGASRLIWQVGKTYAIQSGRGKKGNGRFRIVKIRKETLQSITDEDARAEGVSKVLYAESEWWSNEARISFKRLWNSIHNKSGDRWEDNPSVWVLEIELI